MRKAKKLTYDKEVSTTPFNGAIQKGPKRAKECIFINHFVKILNFKEKKGDWFQFSP